MTVRFVKPVKKGYSSPAGRGLLGQTHQQSPFYMISDVHTDGGLFQHAAEKLVISKINLCSGQSQGEEADLSPRWKLKLSIQLK